MSRRRLVELLLLRWGFAVLVAVAIAAGLAAAISVAPPSDLPSVALQAAVLYRAEVGAAVFLGLYLASVAFALALQNRGFTEVGTGGFRAQDLATVSREDSALEEAVAELTDEIQELRARREVFRSDR